MGYTHYFRRSETKHPQKKWNAFLEDAKKVACRFKLCIPQSIQFITDDDKIIKGDYEIKIGDGMGEGNPPEYTKDKIRFNGVGEEAHETLGIDRVSDDDFGFTKTAHKPYDLLVTATLVLYKHHFGKKVEVSGDGGPDGFQNGLDLVNETLKTSIQLDDVYPRVED